MTGLPAWPCEDGMIAIPIFATETVLIGLKAAAREFTADRSSDEFPLTMPGKFRKDNAAVL